MKFLQRTWIWAVVPALALGLGLSGCDVEKTEPGSMPDVDVEGGELPEYDVEGPDVDIEKETVDVPDEVTVPDVDIDLPNENEN